MMYLDVMDFKVIKCHDSAVLQCGVWQAATMLNQTEISKNLIFQTIKNSNKKIIIFLIMISSKILIE